MLTLLKSVHDNNGAFLAGGKEDFKGGKQRERERDKEITLHKIHLDKCAYTTVAHKPSCSAHVLLSCTYGIWLRWFNERTEHDGKYPLYVDPRWPPAGGSSSVGTSALTGVPGFHSQSSCCCGRCTVTIATIICKITPSPSFGRGGQSSSCLASAIHTCKTHQQCS